MSEPKCKELQPKSHETSTVISQPVRKRYVKHEHYDAETRDALDETRANIEECDSLVAEYEELRRVDPDDDPTPPPTPGQRQHPRRSR